MSSCGRTHDEDIALPPPTPGPRPGETWLHTSRGCHLTTSREWAAEILARVADAAAHGAWPAGVTAFDLGRALYRAAGNVDYLQEEQPGARAIQVREAALDELNRGWRAADSMHGPIDRHDVALPTVEEFENRPDTTRMRNLHTGRLWWLTNDRDWTDGVTIVSSAIMDDTDMDVVDGSSPDL